METTNSFGPQGWTPDRVQDLTNKTYVITGTTSGTGYEAARILLSKGARVLMLNRNPQKAQHTLHQLKTLGLEKKAVHITMDLSQQLSVKEAAAKILQTTDRIDALLCNAAIAQVPARRLTPDGWESQMGVNHFGHFTLQALLFPKLEESAGRIVSVGSMGYDMGLKTIKFDDLNWEEGYTPNNAYSQSKLAQIMTAYELQRRLDKRANSKVKAYACHPGSSRTNLINASGSFTMKLIFGLMKRTSLTQPAVNGAYPSVMCATEPSLDPAGFYGPTGRNFWVGPVGSHELKPHAKDPAVAKRLWERSVEETGVLWSL